MHRHQIVLTDNLPGGAEGTLGSTDGATIDVARLSIITRQPPGLDFAELIGLCLRAGEPETDLR